MEAWKLALTRHGDGTTGSCRQSAEQPHGRTRTGTDDHGHLGRRCAAGKRRNGETFFGCSRGLATEAGALTRRGLGKIRVAWGAGAGYGGAA